MSWVALFWIVYGVGSTVFVVYLFRLGRRVESQQQVVIEEEVRRIVTEQVVQGASQTDESEPVLPAEDSVEDHTKALQVQRVYRSTSDQHLVVQAMRGDKPCVINLPLERAMSMLCAEPDVMRRTLGTARRL